MTVKVHPRVLEKRPWIGRQELLATWNAAFRMMTRLGGYEPDQMMAVGWDWHGRLLEMIAYAGVDDREWILFHAAPARKRFLAEMRFTENEVRLLLGRR